MFSFRHLSIPKKIVAITMIISGAALLMSSAALVTYELIVAQQDLKDSTRTFGEIIANNTTAAVSFNDQPAAVDTLKSLRAEPSIVSACIYTSAGLFAEYLNKPETAPCPSSPANATQSRDELVVMTPIELHGDTIGNVLLRATLAPSYMHLRLEALTLAGILLLSALFAFGLSSRLHKLVSEPILSLAKTASEVYRQKDYSIRATKHSDDELGVLVDSFNEMLGQIQGRTAELIRANKMKDEFLATLSHELRTPLTSIYGWVNLLQTNALDENARKKAIDVIDRNVRAQTQLVDDLLNVSRIITGNLKIRQDWVDAATVIRAAVDSIRPSAAAKGINVSVEIPDGCGPILADPERLQQVIWNLLTNAVKFTESSGDIKIVCRRTGASFQIRVSDSGEGIDPAFIPFVFERFTQADASKTRKHGGLGLGLAIVRHIVESHGGTVSVQSRGKGTGTTFVVNLPVPAVPPPQWIQPEARPASLQGLRVMVVEDERDTREMVAEALKQHGASVLESSSAADALRAIARQQPDVLVSDIAMPDMDGYELIAKIRSEYTSDIQWIPAVALTAFASEADKERSLHAGYQAHLSKPISITELVSTIATIAAGKPEDSRS
jgi:signal transduction histidine kinase/ActR/RegA family two-component response regulator